MPSSCDRPSPTRSCGFQFRQNAHATRRPPPARLTVYPCQETPPSTGGNYIGDTKAVQGCELDTPPKSDEDEQTCPVWDHEGRSVLNGTQRPTAEYPGLEVQKTASTRQFVGTGVAEFNHYLGGFTLPTTGDSTQAIPAANPHQDEHQMPVVSAAAIMLNLRSAKQMDTAARHVAPHDSAFKLAKGTEDEDSGEMKTESAMARGPFRKFASKAAGQNSLAHLTSSDYAYRGPFFVPNTCTSKTPAPGSETSRKGKVIPSSGPKSQPARATLEPMEHVSDVVRHRPTPAPGQRRLNDTDRDSGAGDVFSSSLGDSQDGPDRVLGLNKDPEPRIHKIPGMPRRSLETKTQHQIAQRRKEAGVLYNTSTTQKDGVPVVSSISDSESNLYNLHNPAVSSRLLRRPSCNETGKDFVVGAITQLSPELEQARITDIWSFFAYLICNLRCEEIIEEDEYHEHALWRTCVTLVRDNGCLAVFARMDDPTMVALGVPVSLIPRVWKDLLVWTLADGGSGFGQDDCDTYRMNQEEDARSFVTWGAMTSVLWVPQCRSTCVQ